MPAQAHLPAVAAADSGPALRVRQTLRIDPPQQAAVLAIRQKIQAGQVAAVEGVAAQAHPPAVAVAEPAAVRRAP